ncbi:hypothetical protein M0802_014827 [Mischocyttarus mexicanus]|nr:hypothetical protein M0802_014827 [Mischocyttarus mexicanus]
MKRLLHTNTAPVPTPRTTHTSIKLREIVESVPKFDGSNISVTQFARFCRRALDSLPFDFTDETETNLTGLLISKLSGHAYVVVENLKLRKVEQLLERLKDAFLPSHSSNYYRGRLATEFMKPGDHVLDFYSRIKDFTQSIIEEESKLVGRLEKSVERKIEEEGLDSLIRGLPKDYRTAFKFERFSDFDSALISLLRIDKQIKEDDQRLAFSNIKNRTANIRQINKIIQCDYCKKTGHIESDCFRKKACTHCKRQGHIENRCFLKKKEINGNNSGRNFPNRPSSPSKSNNNKKAKRCSFCRKTGHYTSECFSLKRTIERENQGKDLQGTTKDACRSLTPKQRPRSPSPKPGPSKSNV